MSNATEREGMDRLSTMLRYFSVTAGVFHTGALCGVADFDGVSDPVGHLHILNRGRMELVDGQGRVGVHAEPTLFFFPRPVAHRIVSDLDTPIDLVCASVRFGKAGQRLLSALPECIVVRLAEAPKLSEVTRLVLLEASGEEGGRDYMMDRLCEILVMQLLRQAIASGVVNAGALAGLAHPQLGRCLAAVHRAPAQAWTLEEMARLANMSRSRFVETFKQVVHQSPGDYLIAWRMEAAQHWLRQHKPVGWVANEVGYGRASALAKAFKQRTGMTPRAWLRADLLEPRALS